MDKYNTQRPPVLLKEYGRSIQHMVQNLLLVEDKEARNQQAQWLVEMMKQFNPSLKETADLQHKLWDDLHVMSGFTLDIDSPFPKPDQEMLHKNPVPVVYPQNEIKAKHYGKNILTLLDTICEIENLEERENATIYAARLMRGFYLQYNKDSVEDAVILKDLERLSRGKLKLDPDRVRDEALLEGVIKERRSSLFPDKGSRDQNKSSFGQYGKKSSSTNNNRRNFNNNRKRN